MALSKLIASQLGKPAGLLGELAGWIWNWRNAALNNTVLDALALQPGDRVLDVGFGGGYLLNRMFPKVTAGFLAGVDISPAIVASGKKRYQKMLQTGRLELKCGAVETLPYPAEWFTKVSSVNSIFYWDDVEMGISEIQRVLKTEGMVVLCFTDKVSIEKKTFAPHIQLYESVEIERLLLRHGFRQIKATPFADPYRQYTCMIGEKV